jgi:hypothetical protein
MPPGRFAARLSPASRRIVSALNGSAQTSSAGKLPARQAASTFKGSVRHRLIDESPRERAKSGSGVGASGLNHEDSRELFGGVDPE